MTAKYVRTAPPCKREKKFQLEGWKQVFSKDYDFSEVLTVKEFCDMHKISKSLFQKLKKKGEAPRIISTGGKFLITKSAVIEWRKIMELKMREK